MQDAQVGKGHLRKLRRGPPGPRLRMPRKTEGHGEELETPQAYHTCQDGCIGPWDVDLEESCGKSNNHQAGHLVCDGDARGVTPCPRPEGGTCDQSRGSVRGSCFRQNDGGNVVDLRGHQSFNRTTWVFSSADEDPHGSLRRWEVEPEEIL